VNSRIAITWQSFALFSFVSVIAVPLALVAELNWLNFFYFCGIGVLVTLALGAVLLPIAAAINPWLGGFERKTQEFSILLIITFAGAIRGVFLYWGIGWAGFEEPTDLWTRIGTSTTTTVLWFTLISLIVTSTGTFRDEYEALIRRAVLNFSMNMSATDSQNLPSKLDGELREIEEILQQSFKDKSLMESKESLLLGANRVVNIIETKIRPLSHRLWFESSSSLPKIKIQKTLPASIQHLEIPVVPTSLFLGLATIVNVSSSLGWQRGVVAAAVILIEVYFMLRFFDARIRPKIIGNLSANGIFLLVPGTVLSGTFYLINRFGFSDDIGLLNLIYIVIFPMTAILGSAFQLTKRDRAKLLVEIEELVLHHEVASSQKNLHITQNAASYLHNSLQSELLSISRQLEHSSKNFESKDSQFNLEGLILRLNSSIRDDFQKFLDDPLRRLDKLPSAWKGIAEIKIEIPSEFCENKGRNFVLVQIIEEEIANAIRHAGATSVTVSARKAKNQQIELSIISNGNSIPNESKGLGADWFEHHAPNTWKRELSDAGTELLITI